jgi:hypothetical protein
MIVTEMSDLKWLHPSSGMLYCYNSYAILKLIHYHFMTITV